MTTKNVQPVICLIGVIAILLTVQGTASAKLPVPERGFISAEPAATWEQGLISGNGTLGANMFCRPLDDTVVFTHERLFLPMGDPVVPPDTASQLFKVRQLLDRGLYKQATQYAFDLSGQDGFMYPDPFVPAFDMNIKMDAQGDVADYMRSVDFQTGVATVHWADERGAFERKMFVSRADKVVVLQITGPKAGSVSCRLQLTPRTLSDEINEKTRKRSNDRFSTHIADVNTVANQSFLTFTNSFAKAYPGSIHTLEGVAKVVATGGKVSTEESTMIITGADQVLVFVDIQLIYNPRHPRLVETKQRLSGITPDFKVLLKRHTDIHGEMFLRMKLNVGGDPTDHGRTTEELLAESTNESLNFALVEKEFDAARYNIISCTGELPPVLQGVWAGTYVPSWASDFTHNGNVPSAIAAMMRGNTPELMLAYTRYIESIVPYMEVNAKNIFGARGIVLPSRSTTHGYNNALAPSFAGGMWVAGASWTAHFFYDYYLYTGDETFLAEHCLPIMEKCAVFWEDYLYQGSDGNLKFSPTTSPENFPANTRNQGSFNATMDVAAAKELLTNLITVSRQLKVNKKKIPVWQAMLQKMPPYMYNDDGFVKEWLTPKLADALNHRHSSHLYALYDGLDPEIEGDAELAEGFRKIVAYKLEHHYKKAGFMSFGVVQLGQAATSLGEGELAYAALVRLANSYWLGNLASMHNHRSLFNMDISGGMPAVILKMLVASELGRVKLLPALPQAIGTGSVQGVLCRGQIEVNNLSWDKKTIQVTLTSAIKQSIVLQLPGEINDIDKVEGKVSIRSGRHDNSRKISLYKNEPVTLDIVLK
jgi:alpha-L-fucosidase 2